MMVMAANMIPEIEKAFQHANGSISWETARGYGKRRPRHVNLLDAPQGGSPLRLIDRL